MCVYFSCYALLLFFRKCHRRNRFKNDGFQHRRIGTKDLRNGDFILWGIGNGRVWKVRKDVAELA